MSHTLAIIIANTQIVLRFCETLLGGLLELVERFGLILWHTFARIITIA